MNPAPARVAPDARGAELAGRAPGVALYEGRGGGVGGLPDQAGFTNRRLRALELRRLQGRAERRGAMDRPSRQKKDAGV